MRLLRHSPLAAWVLVVAALLAFGLIGARAGGNAALPGGSDAPAAPVDRGRSDVDALVEHLPSIHVAIETGQAGEWADDLTDRVGAARDRYAAWDGPQLAGWDGIVDAAGQLAAADPDRDRGQFLALASQVDQRVFALAEAIHADR